MRCQDEGAPMTNAELADEIERQLGHVTQEHSAWPEAILLKAEWARVLAALRQTSSDQVLVPREPTQKMSDAFWTAEENSRAEYMLPLFQDCYRAMLAASGPE